jgi:hypothetical protein
VEAGPSKKKARPKPATKALTKKRGVNNNEDSGDGSDEEAGPSRKNARPKPATKAKAKQSTTAKMREKRNSKSKGKGHASKSQLLPSNVIITDTDYEPED